MAATKYTYSISNDFPNQEVDIPRLTQEVQNSTIITALDYIETADDDCDIWFKDALSTEDQTTLDTIVANHSGEPLGNGSLPVHDPDARFDPDGKQVIVPTPAPRGSYTWYTSLGDKTDDPIERGGGTPARITFDAAETGTKSAEIQFVEAVYIHDGEINWRGIDDFDGTDYFSVYVKFCESTGSLTPNPGGTGNCTLSAPYILPADGNGDYDVDLTTACPIPSSQGQWLVNEKTEEITVYDSETGLGKYGMRCLLMAGFTPDPLYLVRNVAMGSPRGLFEIDAYLVEWVSKHWMVGLEVTKTKSPTAAVEVNGILMLFRWNATLNGS